MKEFALKHPILTFFLCDTLICGVVNVLSAFASGRKKNAEEPKEEDAE